MLSAEDSGFLCRVLSFVDRRFGGSGSGDSFEKSKIMLTLSIHYYRRSELTYSTFNTDDSIDYLEIQRLRLALTRKLLEDSC